MNRNALQNLLALGILVGGGGLLLAFFQPRASSEFYISLCSGGVGLAIIILILFINRVLR